MQTRLASWAQHSDAGQEADAILRRCVHCGFCLATCPTYQILGDERDSPRGRIYLIKEVLEGAQPTASTQEHLDRCLTCRNCETTCPSGVEYGSLIDIGRKLVDERVQRPLRQRLARGVLRRLLNSPFFGVALKVGGWLRPLLPLNLRSKIQPVRRPRALPDSTKPYVRKVLLMSGCVQPDMMPSIDASTLRVLDTLGIGVQLSSGAGCCGAVNFHLDAQEAALAQMRRNIDAWLPLLEGGEAEALVVNASGCGAMVAEYPRHLRDDAHYHQKAQRLVDKLQDIVQLVAPHAAQLKARMAPITTATAFHPPCTIQHWQGLRGLSEQVLIDLGFPLKSFADAHLCCGAAGTYSVTQPALSQTLKQRKLRAIQASEPGLIVSSNMGCIGHLQGGTDVPVRHWIEVVDDALVEGAKR